ncbi:MAG TPA: hypothetical protein VGI20_14910 [Rhizomicrobium sp.]
MSVRTIVIAAGFAAWAPLQVFAGEVPPVIQAVSTLRPGDVLFCRYQYHEGSIIARRDCRTSSQWERQRIDLEREVQELQRRGLLQH